MFFAKSLRKRQGQCTNLVQHLRQAFRAVFHARGIILITNAPGYKIGKTRYRDLIRGLLIERPEITFHDAEIDLIEDRARKFQEALGIAGIDEIKAEEGAV